MNTPRSIYLDYAAATPMADHVLAAMQPYFADDFYNPSSPYAPAVKVRHEYEVAKQKIAETFGAKGDELIMTAGATESINLAFRQANGHVISTEIEHPAVLEAAKLHEHTLVGVNQQGVVEPEIIKSAIQPNTTLISVSLANSELGTIQPLKKIAALIAEEKQARAEQGNATPLLFHSDASQGFGQVDVHVARLGLDLLTLNAGKIYGPKQVGLLWAKSSVRMTPDIVGGGQERGLRSGTENIAGVIGFAEAAIWAERHRATESHRLHMLRDLLQEKLVSTFPHIEVLGSQKHRLPGFLSITFPHIDAERIIFLLEDKNVYVATGSACSANKHTASHVLKAIQLDDSLINGSLRITLGRGTDETQVETAAAAITAAVKAEYMRTGDNA